MVFVLQRERRGGADGAARQGIQGRVRDEMLKVRESRRYAALLMMSVFGVAMSRWLEAAAI